MKKKSTLLTGAILGGLGVALGAFGAHAFKPLLIELGRLDTYELAVRYMFYHSFALLLVGLLQQSINHPFLQTSAILISVGTILFSGSLFTLCFTSTKVLAFVTPLGGVLLLLGWAFLALGIFKNQ